MLMPSYRIESSETDELRLRIVQSQNSPLAVIPLQTEILYKMVDYGPK